MYDRKGEEHYNIISALHKSVRASDENAALYWLARMLEGGEDPMYIARRLVVFASEDVGKYLIDYKYSPSGNAKWFFLVQISLCSYLKVHHRGGMPVIRKTGGSSRTAP